MLRYAFGRRVVKIEIGETAVIEKLNVADDPPPGAGLNTFTPTIPALAISAAAIEAVSCVLLTKVVVLLALPH